MKYLVIAIAIVMIAIGTFSVVKKVSPVGWGLWGNTNTSDGVALQGYDAVSYFQGEAPLAGSKDFHYQWRGAEWYFASAANRDRFAADPEHFAPQFGGFCAFAVSKGFTADPNPLDWHIEDDRLYVFADGNVRDDWVASIADGSLQRSRSNWARRNTTN